MGFSSREDNQHVPFLNIVFDALNAQFSTQQTIICWVVQSSRSIPWHQLSVCLFVMHMLTRRAYAPDLALSGNVICKLHMRSFTNVYHVFSWGILSKSRQEKETTVIKQIPTAMTHIILNSHAVWSVPSPTPPPSLDSKVYVLDIY